MGATASHILVDSEVVCQKIKDRIVKAANAKFPDPLDTIFAQAAAEVSTCPSGKSAGGSLGRFSPGQMVPAFDRVIFSKKTELGVVIGPVQTHFGFHLIMVTERSGLEESQTEEEDGKKKES